MVLNHVVQKCPTLVDNPLEILVYNALHCILDNSKILSVVKYDLDILNEIE